MRCATIYLCKKDIFVHSSSHTTLGLWILSEPCVRLDASSTSDVVGRAVLDALQASRSGVPHPTSFTGLLDPLLALAGVKKWAAFAKTARCVAVEEDQGRISLIPTRNLGPKDGFEDDRSGTVVVENVSPERVGADVKRALERAR